MNEISIQTIFLISEIIRTLLRGLHFQIMIKFLEDISDCIRFGFVNHSAVFVNLLICNYLSFFKIAYMMILKNVNMLIFN